MFNFGKKQKTILTHDGESHQDEILGVSILQMYLDKRDVGYRVIRTRDESREGEADYILDIFRKYDGVKYFDHHQRGGAGVRELSGIPYATAGLVWKHFGRDLVSSDIVFGAVDKYLLATADGLDNGVQDFFSINDRQISGSYPSVFAHRLHKFMSTQHSFDILVKDFYKPFLVDFIQKLEKAIQMFEPYDRDAKHIFFDSVDTKFDNFIAYEYFPNLLYYSFRSKDGNFNTYTVSDFQKSLTKAKKPFPESWCGLSGAELEKVSDIKDIKFCHNSGNLLTVTKTKEALDKVIEKIL